MLKFALKSLLTVGAFCVLSNQALADADVEPDTPGAQKAVVLLEHWVKAGAPNGKFSYKDLKGRKWEGEFKADILPLFTKHGIWAKGTQSCASCHSGNTESSLHEMDLTSHAGILRGGDVLSKAPGVPILGEAKIGDKKYNWDQSKLKERLRNNRMPPGMHFDMTEANRDGPCIEASGGKLKVQSDKYGCDLNAVGLIGAWVNAGANDKAFTYGGAKVTFGQDVKPLFTQNGIWGKGTASCSSCHSGHTEASLHEMDLTSMVGVISGGDVLSKAPGVPILGEPKIGDKKYNWDKSKLKARLRNNRMPPGIEFDITEENRDGPIVLHGKRHL
jgi:hypothetical protein